MAVPNLSDFRRWVGKLLTKDDWNFNITRLVEIFSGGTFDLNVNNIQANDIVANSVIADLSGSTGFPTTELDLTAGENLTAGQAVRLSSGFPVKTNATSLAGVSDVLGFVVGTALSGNPVSIETRLFTGLTGLTSNAVYYLSATAGAITTTPPSNPNYVYPIGIALSTTTLLISDLKEVLNSKDSLDLNKPILNAENRNVPIYKAIIGDRTIATGTATLLEFVFPSPSLTTILDGGACGVVGATGVAPDADHSREFLLPYKFGMYVVRVTIIWEANATGDRELYLFMANSQYPFGANLNLPLLVGSNVTKAISTAFYTIQTCTAIFSTEQVSPNLANTHRTLFLEARQTSGGDLDIVTNVDVSNIGPLDAIANSMIEIFPLGRYLEGV